MIKFLCYNILFVLTKIRRNQSTTRQSQRLSIDPITKKSEQCHHRHKPKLDTCHSTIVSGWEGKGKNERKKCVKLASNASPMLGNKNSNNCTKGHQIRQFNCLEPESFSLSLRDSYKTKNNPIKGSMPSTSFNSFLKADLHWSRFVRQSAALEPVHG